MTARPRIAGSAGFRSRMPCAPVLNHFKMPAQSSDHSLAFGVAELLAQLLESKVNHIVVMQLLRGHVIAELEPDAVEQVDFLRRQVGRVWTEIEDVLPPRG